MVIRKRLFWYLAVVASISVVAAQEQTPVDSSKPWYDTILSPTYLIAIGCGIFGAILIAVATCCLIRRKRRMRNTYMKSSNMMPRPVTLDRLSIPGQSFSQSQPSSFGTSEMESLARRASKNHIVMSIPGYLSMSEGPDYRVSKLVKENRKTSLHLAENMQPQPDVPKMLFLKRIKVENRDTEAAFSHSLAILSFIKNKSGFIQLIGFTLSPMTLLFKVYEIGSLDMMISAQHKKADEFWSVLNKRTFVAMIAKSIAVLHQCDISHGAIQPEHVFLEVRQENIVPLLAGFGTHPLSFSPQWVQQKGIPKISLQPCSVAHTSPQVLSGNVPLEKSEETFQCMSSNDIYSFGILVYEILTRQAPFGNQPDTKIKEMVIQGATPFWTNDDSLDNDMMRLAENCWEHNINARWNVHKIFEFFARKQM